MKAIIKNKYIVIPENTKTRKKKVLFYNNKELCFDLDAFVDVHYPQSLQYVDISRFKGKELEIKFLPNADIELEFADEIPLESIYKEPYRPAVHFSPKRGWLNDPNGLFYAKGQYHLFYQHNPASTEWGNMHWGHAVSDDMIFWKELDDTLFPDEMGTMFSGCAFVDAKNVSGLKENDNDVILLFYTAAGDTSELSKNREFTQCLAYSIDNGKTYKKYKDNPIIQNIDGANRDPKVIYCDEIKKYVMTLFIDDHDFAILVSDNLLDWKELQHIEMEDDAECPDFYPLSVENEDGKIKWVFTAASDTYIVGTMGNKGFIQEQKSLDFHNGKKSSYAAQTFDNTDNRRIKIAWQLMPAPFSAFTNQMSIPCEMLLYKTENEYRLKALPVKEFEKLRCSKDKFKDIKVEKSKPFITELKKGAYEILFSPELNTGKFDIDIFGLNINVDYKKNRLALNYNAMPLSYTGKPTLLRLIVDANGAELFSDDGLVFATTAFVMDFNLNYLKITSEDKSSLKDLMIFKLNNIWE